MLLKSNLADLIDKSFTACLTGHRPIKLPWVYNERQLNCIRFKEDLKILFIGAIKYGLINFLTGMAEGFDMIATEILLDLKKTFKHIKVIAIIPCVGQEKKWKAPQQSRYHKIIKKCDDCFILSDSYTNSCMHDRNKFMVEHSSVVIACYNGTASGTRNTIFYAKSKGCKIKIINPNDYTI